MKKSIAIALTSLTLLLAGGSLTPTVANATTSIPDSINITKKDPSGKIIGSTVYLNSKQKNVELRITSNNGVVGSYDFFGSINMFHNIYTSHSFLSGSLYYEPQSMKTAYLINDPSTNENTWVQVSQVEPFH
jgi:hypothetical protein